MKPKSTLFPVVVILLLFPGASVLALPPAGAVANQSESDSTHELKIISAFPDNGAIRFDAFVPIDWKSLARRFINSVNPDAPTPQQIEQLKAEVDMFDNAAIIYRAPLPPELESGFYYLITTTGIHELRPKALKGVVRFGFDQQHTKVQRVMHYGYVMAEASTGKRFEEGGFILYSNSKPSLTSLAVQSSGESSSSLTLDERRMVWTYKESGKIAELPVFDNKWPRAYLGAYILTVQPAVRRFLFVRWEPDVSCWEACCQFIYRVYEIREKLEPVAGTDYQCDV